MLLDELVEGNSRAIKKALVSAENRRRKEARLSLLPEGIVVWLPSGPSTDMRLLNWRVWSMRYGVTIEYVLDAVILTYGKTRKWSRREGELLFGFSVALVTGETMRERLEERVARDFPNDEHRKVATLRQARSASARYQTLEEMVKKYDAEMKRRQKEFAAPPLAEERERNYRKQ